MLCAQDYAKIRISSLALLVVVSILLIGFLSNRHFHNKQKDHAQERINGFRIVVSQLLGEVASGGRLPTTNCVSMTGQDIYSWRVPTLLWLFNVDFPRKESWESPTLRVYELAGSELVSDYESTDVFLLAVTGESTAFGEQTDFNDIDTRNTIILIESYLAETHWMAPVDLPVKDILSGRASLGSPGYIGFCVAFADGEVWYLDKNIPISKLADFLQLEGSEDREDVLLPYRLYQE